MIRWNQAPLDRDQAMLFCPTLDAAISQDHPVRLIEEVLGQMDWSAWEAQYCLVAGQPPIPPRVLAGAILYGLTLGIRSSRKLEDACRNRMDFLWLVEGRVVDHSTFCDFRTRFAEPLKQTFRQIVMLGKSMGMVQLNQLCIDGTRIRANNARYNTARSGKLEQMLAQADQQITQLLQEAEAEDRRDAQLYGPEKSAAQLPATLRTLQQRQEKLKKALTELRAMEAKRGQRKDVSAKGPQIPLADPDARVLPNKEGGYAPNYTPLTTTETHGGFIVDAEVIIGNNEEAALLPAVERMQKDFGEKPQQVMADSGFHTGPNLADLEQQKVQALIPAKQEFDQNPAVRPDPTVAVDAAQWPALPINPQAKVIDKAAFIYQEQTDQYYCPMGRALVFCGTQPYERDNGKGIYRVYESPSCAGCPLARQCLRKNQAVRRIFRDPYDAVRERVAVGLMSSAGQEAYRKRMSVAESPFGIIKTTMHFRQFLLRGIDKVRIEWRWAVTAFDLAKLARRMAESRKAAALKGGVVQA